MLTLYGISASRAFRNLWLLEELGADYRHEPVDYRNGAADFQMDIEDVEENRYAGKWLITHVQLRRR